MPAKSGRISLSINDGSNMSAYVARPENPSGSGILVLQEAFGVNGHIRNVADRFAGEGYLAIAPEMFHRTAPGAEFDYKDFSATMPHMQAMTIPGNEADLRACFDWLNGQPEVKNEAICSVGFCMGGRLSYLADSILPLRAAVSFYGGGIAPGLLDRASALKAPMLFFWGGLDRHITPELRHSVAAALDSAKKVYANVEFSDADHGFFCDERAAYNPRAAKLAWGLMLEFLRSYRS